MSPGQLAIDHEPNMPKDKTYQWRNLTKEEELRYCCTLPDDVRDKINVACLSIDSNGLIWY